MGEEKENTASALEKRMERRHFSSGRGYAMGSAVEVYVILSVCLYK